MRGEILFISHDATRTGAPIFLRDFLRWSRGQAGLSFDLLVMGGGELKEEFKALGARRHYYLRKAFRRSPLLSKLFFRYLVGRQKGETSLVYCNTIVAGRFLPHLEGIGAPVLTHVHELENMIDTLSQTELRDIDQRTTLFVAASGAVREALVGKYGIDAAKVAVVNSFIDTARFHPSKVKQGREALLQSLGISPGSFVVGACGTVDSRKAPELFVRLAQEVAARSGGKEVSFVWVGGTPTPELCRELDAMGVRDAVRFVARVDNTVDYFNAFDAFSLVSRVDPFPLVCLEAAALGKPILCFADAGGMKEFVESDCGYVIAGMSVESMADKVVQLAQDPDLCKNLGLKAAEKVRLRHDLAVAAPRLLECARRCIEQTSYGCKGVECA